MSDKKTNSEVNKMIKRMFTPSVFTDFVREIDADEIPSKYVDRISVFYTDGNIVELSGNEILHPIPVNRTIINEESIDPFDAMEEIKIYINTDKLEIDVNKKVEEYLGKFC